MCTVEHHSIHTELSKTNISAEFLVISDIVNDMPVEQVQVLAGLEFESYLHWRSCPTWYPVAPWRYLC